jgi:hypothetical protein
MHGITIQSYGLYIHNDRKRPIALSHAETQRRQERLRTDFSISESSGFQKLKQLAWAAGQKKFGFLCGLGSVA